MERLLQLQVFVKAKKLGHQQFNLKGSNCKASWALSFFNWFHKEL